MAEVFLRVVNMSISAGYLVIAILLSRPLLKRTPKWIKVVLWGILGLRLLSPFSFESILSLIPSAETLPHNIMTDNTPEINSGIPIINDTFNPVFSDSFTPDPSASANPLQILIPLFSAVWIIGMTVLLVYAAISYALLKRRVGTAVLLKDNIYQSENVSSPFVLGIFKPRIYLPFSISEETARCVIAHENAHIKRKDHLWKPLGFLILSVHWFNPLIWVAYVFLCRDIEFACDERVIRGLDRGEIADYSEALLACGAKRVGISACPLAFGELGIGKRIKSVLSYKKPGVIIIVISLVLCIAMAVCFLTNPSTKSRGETNPSKLSSIQLSLMEDYPDYFGLNFKDGLDIYVTEYAKDSYSFILKEHKDEPESFQSLMYIETTGLNEMRHILESYNIDADDIYIIPWQNPISSYIGEYWTVKLGEDAEAKRAAYIENIRELLFINNDTVRVYYVCRSFD